VHVLDEDHENSGFWSGVPDRRRSHRDTSRDITRPTARPGARVARSAAAIAPATRLATGEHAVVRSHHAELPRRGSQSLRRAGVLGVTVLLLVPVAMALRAEAASPRRVAPLATTPVSAVGSTVVKPDALAAADASAKVAIEALSPIVPEPTDPPSTQAALVAQRAAAPVKASPTTVKAAKPVAKKAPAACTKYPIAAGDAWITIAHRAGTTLGALLKVNQARTTSALTPGHTICLPAGTSIATPTAKAAPKATTTTSKASTSDTTHTTSPPTTDPELVPPPNTYTRDDIIQIIRDVWPDDLEDHAIAIADRESHLNPSARNFCCYGLFQVYYSVHRTWLGTIGVFSPAQLWDPRVNALVAYQMYLRSGFAPWGG
jgi:LysM repeat protein